MAQPTASQRAWRRRIETGIRLAVPALDLVLAAGDRLARATSGGELEAPAPEREIRRGPRTRLAPGPEGG